MGFNTSEEYNVKLLRQTDLSNAVTVHKNAMGNIEAKLVSMQQLPWKSAWTLVRPTEVLFVVTDGKPVAFVEKLGRNNVYFYTDPEYRNQHILSDIIRHDFLRYLWPDIVSIWCNHPEHEAVVQRLAKISGLPVRNTPEPSQKDVNASNQNYVELMSNDYVAALRCAMVFPEAIEKWYIKGET